MVVVAVLVGAQGHPMSELSPLRPRRRRLIGCLVAGALLLLAVYGGLALFWDRELTDALAEAERDIPHWRMYDLEDARAVLPEEENSSELIVSIKALTPRYWPIWYLDPPPTQSDTQPLEDRVAFEERLRRRPPNVRLDEEQKRVFRAECDRAACAIHLSRALVDYPRGRHPLKLAPDGISTLLPRTQEARQVGGLLEPDIDLRAEEGDLVGALESCHAVLNAARSMGDEPYLISCLVRIALRAIAVRKLERVLAQGEPPTEALAALQRQLEEEDEYPLLLQGARGDRAMLDTLLEGVQEGRVPVNHLVQQVRVNTGASRRWAELSVRASVLAVKPQRAECLRLMNRYVAIAARPPEDQEDAMTLLFDDMARTKPLVRQLIHPAAEKCYYASQRSHVDLRCAVLMLAMERFRQAHQRWPTTPDELVPAYLARAPRDPHDGGPLRCLRREDGWVIYSPGRDKMDDGGNVWPISAEAGSDWGYRLWDVAARRQPPSPDGAVTAPASGR